MSVTRKEIPLEQFLYAIDHLHEDGNLRNHIIKYIDENSTDPDALNGLRNTLNNAYGKETGDTALTAATRQSDHDLVKHILKKLDQINHLNAHNQSAFAIASEKFDIKMLEKLVKRTSSMVPNNIDLTVLESFCHHAQKYSPRSSNNVDRTETARRLQQAHRESTSESEPELESKSESKPDMATIHRNAIIGYFNLNQTANIHIIKHYCVNPTTEINDLLLFFWIQLVKKLKKQNKKLYRLMRLERKTKELSELTGSDVDSPKKSALEAEIKKMTENDADNALPLAIRKAVLEEEITKIHEKINTIMMLRHAKEILTDTTQQHSSATPSENCGSANNNHHFSGSYYASGFYEQFFNSSVDLSSCHSRQSTPSSHSRQSTPSSHLRQLSPSMSPTSPSRVPSDRDLLSRRAPSDRDLLSSSSGIPPVYYNTNSSSSSSSMSPTFSSSHSSGSSSSSSMSPTFSSSSSGSSGSPSMSPIFYSNNSSCSSNNSSMGPTLSSNNSSGNSSGSSTSPTFYSSGSSSSSTSSTPSASHSSGSLRSNATSHTHSSSGSSSSFGSSSVSPALFSPVNIPSQKKLATQERLAAQLEYEKKLTHRPRSPGGRQKAPS